MMLRQNTIFLPRRLLKLRKINHSMAYCPHCLNWHNNYSTKHLKYFKEVTGFSDRVIMYALDENKHKLKKITQEKLEAGLKAVEGLGIANSPLELLPLLREHMVTIRNRGMFLQEAGLVGVTPKMISRYFLICKSSIAKLKESNNIEENTNVLQRMLSYTDFPESLKQGIFLSDSLSILEVKREVLRIYLKWKLDISDEKLRDEGILMYRLQNKSLREMMNNIEFAARELGIQGPRLKKNVFLLHMDPKNAKEILDKVQEILDIPVRDLAARRAKIITCPVDHLLKIKQYFKEFNIKRAALQKKPEVLTLKADTVLKRLKEAHKNEFFRLCSSHPSFLDLIYYHKKATKRLKLAYEMKIHCLSLSSFFTVDSVFHSRCSENGMCRPMGVEILYYLGSELGLKKREVRAALRPNPYWNYVSLVRIASTLEAVKKRGFTKDEIVQDLLVLFYPKEKVLEELDKLEARGEEVSACVERGQVRRSLVLRLVIYYLEREVNFTGEGVWAVPPGLPDTLPPSPKHLIQPSNDVESHAVSL